MRSLWIKLILFLCIWYEVSTELGLSGGTAMVVTLLVCGAALMLLRVPGQLMSLLGPRTIALAGPVVVWMGLAWWLMPTVVTSYPALALVVAAGLVVAGAAARYAVTRYAVWLSRHAYMLRASISPGISILLGLADQLPRGLLSLAVIALLIGMPVRLGWRLIGPPRPAKFDAKMGDAEGFRHAGFSDEA
jgi:hypothetical protein